MKPKQREDILNEFKLLKSYLQENSAAVKIMFPDIVPQIKEIYNEVLYQNVDARDHGIVFKKIRKGRILSLVKMTVELQTDLSNELLKSEKDKVILVENLKKANLASQLPTTDLFGELNAALAKVIEDTSGIFIYKEEFKRELSDAVKNTYMDLDVGKIEKCRDVVAIQNLGIDLIDTFLEEYKLKRVPKEPDYDGFISAIDTIFDDYSMLTQAEFETQVKAWIDDVTKELAPLAKDKFAQAPIIISEASVKLSQQTAKFVEGGLGLIGTAVVEAISNIEDGLSLEEVIQVIPNNIASVKIPFLSPDQLAEFSKKEGDITKTLSSVISFSEALLAGVDPSSPIFIVNQPKFRSDLETRLNEWKDEFKNALTEGADLILKLDGCTVDGSNFQNSITSNIKVDGVAKALSALSLETIKLRGHKDLSIFEEKWSTPWNNAVDAIDPVKDIIPQFDTDPNTLLEFSKDIYSYLPSDNLVISSLNTAIGGKINLALERVKQLEKKVVKIDERVTITENVVDMLSLATGYGSMMSEVDLVFKEIVKAQQDYSHKVKQHSAQYHIAYNQVEVSIADFNKASDELKAFHEAIFDAVLGIATTLIGGPIVGSIAGSIAKKFAGACEELIEEVASKAIETAVNFASDTLGGKSAALEAARGSYPKLENNSTKPFLDYLKRQLKAEEEVLYVLQEILCISMEIQHMANIVQWVIDNKLPVELGPFKQQYNDLKDVLVGWLKDVKGALNNYNKATGKIVVYDAQTYEHDMYIDVLSSLSKRVDSNTWNIMCQATAFRKRLIVCKIIGEKDFIDKWWDSGWTNEFKKMYNQKRHIPINK